MFYGKQFANCAAHSLFSIKKKLLVVMIKWIKLSWIYFVHKLLMCKLIQTPYLYTQRTWSKKNMKINEPKTKYIKLKKEEQLFNIFSILKFNSINTSGCRPISLVLSSTSSFDISAPIFDGGLLFNHIYDFIRNT